MGGENLNLSKRRMFHDYTPSCLVDEEVPESQRASCEMVRDGEGGEDGMTRQDGET